MATETQICNLRSSLYGLAAVFSALHLFGSSSTKQRGLVWSKLISSTRKSVSLVSRFTGPVQLLGGSTGPWYEGWWYRRGRGTWQVRGTWWKISLVLQSGELELTPFGGNGCLRLKWRSENGWEDNSSLVLSHVIFIWNDRRAGFDDEELAGSVVVRMSCFYARVSFMIIILFIQTIFYSLEATHLTLRCASWKYLCGHGLPPVGLQWRPAHKIT
jgi:hypothetical protein